MPICSMKDLIYDAEKTNRAVGSFSVGNMEMIMGVIKGAENMNTPIIIQIAEARLKHANLEMIGSMMVSAAKQSKVDIAVHFDHGTTKENIKKALDIGFTSVMYDGSSLLFEKNIENTVDIVTLAKKYGAIVEAELGQVGGNEGGTEDLKVICTDPDQAALFVEKTNIDALAVAIGNAHGNYKNTPKLQLDVLKEIEQKVNVPLVLHGGTGISDSDFRKCIDLGIRKINIATSTFDTIVSSAKNYTSSSNTLNYFSMNEKMIDDVCNNTIKHIEIFNNTN